MKGYLGINILFLFFSQIVLDYPFSYMFSHDQFDCTIKQIQMKDFFITFTINNVIVTHITINPYIQKSLSIKARLQ